MSSTDLHYQFLLEKQFHHIQAMVIHISGSSIGKFDFFQLNRNGHSQLAQCFKKPGTTHAACGKFDYYKKGLYDFHSLKLTVKDFRKQYYKDMPWKNLHGTEINEAHTCEDCSESFQTLNELSIHIANEHVINLDYNEPKEISQGCQNSDTSKHIYGFIVCYLSKK